MASVSQYYHLLESRIGYRLLLGGTRHFGYYKVGTWWPFPIGAALRRMEEQLYQALDLKSDSLVLDGGAGIGDVALYMARQGLYVTAIDLLDLHVGWAKSNIESNGQAGRVKVLQMNYQDLAFDNDTFDGVYTMETLVHADDPDRAIWEFYRVLKPGGVLANIEYEHNVMDKASALKNLLRVNTYSHMPAFTQFSYGALRKKMEDIGFQVEVQDLSENALPMLRLFFVLALFPYLLIRLFQQEARFPNAVAAVDLYQIRHDIRVVLFKARKPGGGVNVSYQHGRYQLDLDAAASAARRREEPTS